MSATRRVFRCPDCRTRRLSFSLLLAHIASSGHRLCDCGGYHYRHRPGSPYCYANPMAPVLHASRGGASDADLADIEMEVVFNHKGRLLRRWPYDKG